MADRAGNPRSQGDMMALPYDIDTVHRTQIGLIVLQADETLEDDMRRLLPDDVSCLVSRVPSAKEVTSETLRQMEGHLTEAASRLPRAAEFAAIGYGCTSGTAEIGASAVADLISAGAKTRTVSEPVSALIAACSHLGLSRLSFVSPYVAEVSHRLREVLHDAEIETPLFESFEEPLEEHVARISETSIIDAALKIGKDDMCEAVFLSCTNLKTLSVIPAIEAFIGKPVLSSNQVLGWHLCAISGVPLRSDFPGLLGMPPTARHK